MKILIVDDEVIVVRALERAFKSRGHQVRTAHDGSTGLEVWGEGGFDVVLLDVIMPGLTGPQVISEYQKIKGAPEAKVVLMTAHSGVKEKEAIALLKVSAFFEKPFENIFNFVDQVEKLRGNV